MLSNRFRTTSVALAVAATVVGTGALTVSAQDTTATPVAPAASDSTQTAQTQPNQPPQGPGRGFGRGMMMGLDLGADGNLADSPIVIAIADALKLEPAALVTDLQSGKSVTDLATAQSVDIQTVYDAVIAKHKQLLDAEVTTGYLTQEQADTRLQTFTDNIAKFPLFAMMQFPNPADTQGQGFGPGNGNGPQGGFGGGRGQGGRGGFGPGGNGPQGGFGPGNNGNGPFGQRGNHGPWGNNQQNGQPNQPTDPNAPANPTAPQTSPAVTPEATQAASA